MSGPLRLVMVSGEPSGDRLGAPLIRALRAAAGREIEITGIGGELMQAEGLIPLFDADELAIMGIAEIAPKIFSLLARIRQTVGHVAAVRPDALITIDSPGFGLRVAARARAVRRDLRTIHYVAPSVWAWRPGRAAHMARFVDHVLALLPFEPPYMIAAGMTCDFVGHPVVEHAVPGAAAASALRAELGIGARPMLVVLPGSRGGEISRLSAPFAQTLAHLGPRVPGLAVVVPASRNVAAATAAAAASWPGEVHVLDPRAMTPAAAEARKFTAFAAADAALAASGTVALELAAMGAAQVTAYRVNALTAMIVKRLVLAKHVNLVNILLGARIVPEFVQDALVPAEVAEALAPLLSDPGARAAQHAAADRALTLLGRGGEAPSARAAASVLAALARG